MRGRLIFGFLAGIHRLDTKTAALQSGYDPDFKEPVLVDMDDDGIGERIRREHPAVRLTCQVEPEALESLQAYPSGDSPRSVVRLVFHYAELERIGLVDAATGSALIHVGDRLGALYDLLGELVQVVRTPPGLYVTEAKPIGFGLSMSRPRRNLLLVSFEDRDTAASRGAF